STAPNASSMNSSALRWHALINRDRQDFALGRQGAVTWRSRAMRDRISRTTGREATMIAMTMRLLAVALLLALPHAALAQTPPPAQPAAAPAQQLLSKAQL